MCSRPLWILVGKMAGEATVLKVALRGGEAIVFEKSEAEAHAKRRLVVRLILAERRETQRNDEAGGKELAPYDS